MDNIIFLFSNAWFDIYKHPEIDSYLNMICENTSIEILLKFNHLLPYLNSLKIRSLPLIQSDWLFDNDGQIYSSISINNKIRAVSIAKISNIKSICCFQLLLFSNRLLVKRTKTKVNELVRYLLYPHPYTHTLTLKTV
jgi:hypothetical protein